jgi:FMN reductase
MQQRSIQALSPHLRQGPHRAERDGGNFHIVGLSGNIRRPSKTRTLVEKVLERVGQSYGVAGRLIDLSDMLPELGTTFDRHQLSGRLAAIVEAIETADLLVIGTPVYKGSFAGMLKHLIDLLDPHALRAVPVVLVATGGGDRHALIVEHQLRPLLGFFMAHAMPVAIYASDRDFDGGRLVADAILRRIEDCVNDLAPWMPAGQAGDTTAVDIGR